MRIYNITLPLNYNRYAVFQENPVLASDYIIEQPIKGSFQYDLDDKTQRDANYVICQEGHQPVCHIENVLGISQNDVMERVKKVIHDICIELTFLLVRHEDNLRTFQPRIEPNWRMASFTSKSYDEDGVLDYPSYPFSIGTISLMHIEDNVSITLRTTKDFSDFCLDKQCDDNYSFLVNELYFALGTENIKSKFFHLFSIISFCEERYKKESKSKQVFTKDDCNRIFDYMRNESNICEAELKIKKLSEFNVREKLTDIGRNEALLNILSFMGITHTRINNELEPITSNILREITRLRNDMFHVNRIDEFENKIKDSVERLLYIDIQILDYLRKQKES